MDGKLYSLKDTKLGKFGMPFVAPNDEIAKRMLHSTVNAGETTVAEYPEDFQLYLLGSYNDDTGELTSELKFIANATEFSNKKGEVSNGIQNGVDTQKDSNNTNR